MKKACYLPELDGLRFFAFLLVFIHHQDLFGKIPFLSLLKTNGWIGVDLFFVLSAFLFTLLLRTEYEKTGSIDIKRFYIRRIFRIWPIYYLFVAFSVSVFIFYYNEDFSSYNISRFVGLMTFSDNVFAAFSGYNPFPYLRHLWTIGYEEQFYIFIPIILLLLIRASKKRRWVIFIGIIVSFNLIRLSFIILEFQHPAIWVLPFTHFESIILGIVIGFGGMNFISRIIPSAVLMFLGIVLFVSLSLFPDLTEISYSLMISYTLVGILTAFTLLAVLNNTLIKRFLTFHPFVFLGKRSYGLYVYHLLGNSVAGYISLYLVGTPSNAIITFSFSITFTIIVSIISYHVIEKPFLKLKRNFEIISTRPV